jgi:hypothetical protein
MAEYIKKMDEQDLVGDILTVVRESECTLDELLRRVKGECWTDVLYEVYALSKAGHLDIIYNDSACVTSVRARH